MTQRPRTRPQRWGASSLAVLALLLSVAVAGPAQARVGASTGTAVSAADAAFAASVAGAGTMQPIKKSQAAVNLYASKAKHKTSNETEHVKELDKLVD